MPIGPLGPLRHASGPLAWFLGRPRLAITPNTCSLSTKKQNKHNLLHTDSASRMLCQQTSYRNAYTTAAAETNRPVRLTLRVLSAGGWALSCTCAPTPPAASSRPAPDRWPASAAVAGDCTAPAVRVHGCSSCCQLHILLLPPRAALPQQSPADPPSVVATANNLPCQHCCYTCCQQVNREDVATVQQGCALFI